MEVSTVFTGGKFRTSIHLITKWLSLSPSSHPCTVLYPSHDEPTFCKGTVQAYHVPSK
ncbi:MAG: hypothetical protein K8S16_22100 [Bacteroidales bacterium]|nr:hypothetical protein [Bacteroidales bacterium]